MIGFLISAFSVFLAFHAAQQNNAFGQTKAAEPVKVLSDSNALGHQNEIKNAKELLAKGAVSEAIVLLRRVLKQDSGNADAHLLLGTALALVPRRSEALAELNRAIELRPGFAPGYNTLGMVLGRFAEPDTAREAFEKAIRLDPQLAEAHANLSLVLAQRNEFSLAREHVARAIQLEGNSPVAAYWHYLKGKIYYEQDMPQEAIKEFEEAIRLRPNYVEAYLSLGIISRRLSDSVGSVRAFQKAVQLAPKNPVAHYSLGAEYLSQGKSTSAVEHLREAARLQPQDRKVLYSLSRALRNTGQVKQARMIETRLRAILQSADQVRTKTLEATRLNNEGVELEKSSKLSAALEKYRSALELDPFHGGYRRNLALGLCRLGRWEQGIAELREILRQDPNDEDTTRALYIALEKAAEAKAANSVHP